MTHTERPNPSDAAVLTAQLGREPRGSWSVAGRCEHGHPSVMLTAPVLDDGTPFPTLYWLTCPWLVRRVDSMESAGAVSAWAARLVADPGLAVGLIAADREYRRRRGDAAGGSDPMPGTGIAGQRDPLATKCLHAHVAGALACIDDPVGAAVLAEIDPLSCPDGACARRIEGPPA